MQILCDLAHRPIRADTTNGDVISDKNLSNVNDWPIMSPTSNMVHVNNMMVHGSQKHDSRHPLIGQNLEVKSLLVLHN